MSAGDDRFTEWMRRVDSYLEAIAQCVSDDLPDWEWRDAFDDESTPEVAALAALRANGWPE
jgi:hypothetical protein